VQWKIATLIGVVTLLILMWNTLAAWSKTTLDEHPDTRCRKQNDEQYNHHTRDVL
jgi:hypothetical protein